MLINEQVMCWRYGHLTSPTANSQNVFAKDLLQAQGACPLHQRWAVHAPSPQMTCPAPQWSRNRNPYKYYNITGCNMLGPQGFIYHALTVSKWRRGQLLFTNGGSRLCVERHQWRWLGNRWWSESGTHGLAAWPGTWWRAAKPWTFAANTLEAGGDNLTDSVHSLCWKEESNDECEFRVLAKDTHWQFEVCFGGICILSRLNR